ncbi:ArsR/SmtB family transcription factor [Mycoplasma sp. P36-A1]|uniref:ArsR/SmtB family transcription factor n=1 Tax=Mycoplasma sp. P36-A1 TaxID=3252900 RepID=UPI003C2F2729
MESQIFKLLGDENRLRVVVLLLNRELCMSHISLGLKLKQANTSKILKTLNEEGIVSIRAKKNNRYYSINEQCINKYPDIFEYIRKLQSNKIYLEDLEYAKSIENCGCQDNCECRF